MSCENKLSENGTLKYGFNVAEEPEEWEKNIWPRMEAHWYNLSVFY